jgi:hypothetical protein
MGKLISWGFGTSKDDRCSYCGMKKGNKNCCNEQQKLIKLADDQKVSSLSYELTYFAAVIHYNYPLIVATPVLPAAQQNPLSHSPPSAGSIPIYLSNCIFRI